MNNSCTYILNYGILTDIQFKLQAILNKCQNKSLKLIVNYTSPPTTSIKRAMNARKLHKQLFVNWKALKPPTSFIKLQTSFNFDRNHFTEIFSLFSCLNLWLKSRCNLHDYVHLLRRYICGFENISKTALTTNYKDDDKIARIQLFKHDTCFIFMLKNLLKNEFKTLNTRLIECRHWSLDNAYQIPNVCYSNLCSQFPKRFSKTLSIFPPLSWAKTPEFDNKTDLHEFKSELLNIFISIPSLVYVKAVSVLKFFIFVAFLFSVALEMYI